MRAETSGVVSRVTVEDGQAVAAGAVMASISDPTLQGDIEAAQAKVNEARANLNALEAGGKPAEFTEIENNLARARFDLAQARKTLASLERLAEKHAATQQEVDAARDKAQQFELEIAGLEKRRGSLVSPPDVAAARARLADAESAVRLAQQRAALSAVHAPMAGTVYGREIRQGSYVNAGDLVANIGRMDQLRVRVYVDEPELGRVAEGQPVTITWDALPGRQWQGQGGEEARRHPGARLAPGGRSDLRHRERGTHADPRHQRQRRDSDRRGGERAGDSQGDVAPRSAGRLRLRAEGRHHRAARREERARRASPRCRSWMGSPTTTPSRCPPTFR